MVTKNNTAYNSGDEEKVMGSSFLSNIIIIDLIKYRLKDIVDCAFSNSHLDLVAWNKLKWADRDDIIGAQIYYMRVKLEARQPVTWKQALNERVKDAEMRKILKIYHIRYGDSVIKLPKCS